LPYFSSKIGMYFGSNVFMGSSFLRYN
jgi:hypothetical protein